MKRRVLRIDVVMIVLYLLLAVALLFAVNVHAIWQFLTSHYSDNSSPVPVDYSSISPPLFNYLNKLSALPLMIFWAFVGTISYMLAIWLQRAFSTAFEEAKEAKYVRPATKQAAYWHNTIYNNLKIAGLAVTWVVSLYIFVQLLLPHFSKLLDHSLNAGSVSQRVGYFAGALVLTATCLFLIVELSQLLKRGWHRFSAISLS